MKLPKALHSTYLSMLAFALLTTCTGTNDQAEESNDEEFDSTMFLPRTDLLRITELKTPSGMSWLVKESPMMDSSLVNVSVEVRGLSVDSVTFDFGEIDPVTAVRQDDLDKNGFAELYIVTQSTGSELYGTIYGLYLHNDSSISMISYEGANPYTMKEGEPYADYQGHDNFVFQDGLLTNTFSVGKTDDTNPQATGVERKVSYELVKGEASVVLRPVRPSR